MSTLYQLVNGFDSISGAAFGGGGGGGGGRGGRSRRAAAVRRAYAARTRAATAAAARARAATAATAAAARVTAATKSGGYLNDVCNTGLAVSNIGILATAVTKNPYVAGATVVTFTATTGICAAAFGAGERSTMF